jgi:hypothetical protein
MGHSVESVVRVEAEACHAESVALRRGARTREPFFGHMLFSTMFLVKYGGLSALEAEIRRQGLFAGAEWVEDADGHMLHVFRDDPNLLEAVFSVRRVVLH